MPTEREKDITYARYHLERARSKNASPHFFKAAAYCLKAAHAAPEEIGTTVQELNPSRQQFLDHAKRCLAEARSETGLPENFKEAAYCLEQAHAAPEEIGTTVQELNPSREKCLERAREFLRRARSEIDEPYYACNTFTWLWTAKTVPEEIGTTEKELLTIRDKQRKVRWPSC